MTHIHPEQLAESEETRVKEERSGKIRTVYPHEYSLSTEILCHDSTQ